MPQTLLDTPKDLIDIAGILSQNTTLQHQGIRFTRAISHFAKADQSLIRVEFQECTMHWRPHDIYKPQISDAQF